MQFYITMNHSEETISDEDECYLDATSCAGTCLCSQNEDKSKSSFFNFSVLFKVIFDLAKRLKRHDCSTVKNYNILSVDCVKCLHKYISEIQETKKMQLTSFEANKQELLNRITNLNKRTSEIGDKRKYEYSQILDLKKKNKQLKYDISREQEKLNEMKHAYQLLSKENSSLKSQNVSLVSQMKNICDTLAELTHRKSEFERENSSFKTTIGNLMEKLAQSENMLKNMSKEIANLRSNNHELEKANEIMLNELSELNKNNIHLLQETHTCRNKMVHLKETLFLEKATAESEAYELKKQIKDLESALQCAICLENKVSVVFSCGHAACKECSVNISSCHMCRKPIRRKLELYTN